MTTMYSQFLSQGPFLPLPEDGAADNGSSFRQEEPAAPPPRQSHSDLLGDVTGSLREVLSGVFKQFSLEKFDTGDILLVLILLFLFLEGDNLELVITLGLMLLLGLGEE